jgi:hypothetical protein
VDLGEVEYEGGTLRTCPTVLVSQLVTRNANGRRLQADRKKKPDTALEETVGQLRIELVKSSLMI